MALKRIILFVLILSVFFVYAIPLAPSNSIDSSDDIAEDMARGDVSFLEQNGGIDREKREANDDDSSDSLDEALEENSEERLREVRQADDDDGKDNGGDDSDDDDEEGDDDDDLDEIPKKREARETDDDNEDDDEDDLEENTENREAREADDDTEDDDEDDLDDDSEDREAREADDEEEEEEDEEEGDNDDDKKNEIERELNELDALTGSRKKRDVAPKPTIAAAAGTKPAAHVNNTKCTRSITLEDLDKLLKEADSEEESRNKRNMEDEEQDNDDDDDEDFEDFLSRKRRDVGDDDDDVEAEDDDDDEEEDDEDRRKRDTSDDDDDEDEEDDDDDDDEDDGDRKKRGEEEDNEEDDSDDEDAYLQNLMRIMRDTEGSKADENKEENKEQPIVTRDLEATNNAEVEDKNSQADSYVDQNANSPEGFQNLAKREDYDYPGDDYGDLAVDVNKRDEEFNQGLSEGSEEMNHRFLESNEEKSKRKPIVSSIIIDEPDNFSLIETGNETKVIMNNGPNNAAQATTNEPADSYQPGNTKTPDINENTVYPDDDKSESPRQQRSESPSKLAGNLQRAYGRPEWSNDRTNNGISKREPNSPKSGLPKNADEPRGPIAMENKLSKAFAGMFYQNPKVNIQWVEPDTLGNCWVHAMLAHTLDSGFSPSCNQDGSYSPKQCFLQRCWCVSRDGSPEDPNFNTRFAYAIKGAMLKCTQVYR